MITGLRKRFGQVEVLAGVDLHAPAGAVTGLLGCNGSGKSTLFALLMGLVRADGGRALLGGRDLLPLPVHAKAAAGLGYLPQESPVFGELGVEANLEVVLGLAGVRSRERSAAAGRLLERVGLAALAGRRAGVLSGGERRRLALAMALAHPPAVLLLDEPFAGLDPTTVDDLIPLLRSLAAEGMAVLVTDHQPQAMLALCDRLALLAGGRMLCEGTPAEFRSDQQVRRSYLGNLVW